MFEKMVKSRNKKGFTLMEMLIVIAIIAILIAIATPVLMGQLKKAKAVADGAQLSNANSIAAVYVLSNTPAKGETTAQTAAKIMTEADTQGIPDTSTLDGQPLTCGYVDAKGTYMFWYGDHSVKYYQAIAQGSSEADAATNDTDKKKAP